MKAETTRLAEHAERTDHIRRAGINPNRWYMIAKAAEVREQPVGREIWRQPVVLFRDGQGELHALEDRCAHRLVRLSHGRVIDDNIECAYHGWQYSSAGRCLHVPNLAAKTTLPNCRIRSFPVVEKYGFAWIFPGNAALSRSVAPMAMDEWDDLDEIPSWVKLTSRAHFSYLIENLMDMYHGALHAQYQVWTAKALKEVTEAENQVTATYQATTYYRVKDLYVSKGRSLKLPNGLIAAAILLLAAASIVLRQQGYTSKALASCGFFLLFAWLIDRPLLNNKQYWLWLGICYVPFLIINSVLTALPVVEYNPAAIFGFRVFSIPVEDFFYNYAMLSFYLLFYRMHREPRRE